MFLARSSSLILRSYVVLLALCMLAMHTYASDLSFYLNHDDPRSITFEPFGSERGNWPTFIFEPNGYRHGHFYAGATFLFHVDHERKMPKHILTLRKREFEPVYLITYNVPDPSAVSFKDWFDQLYTWVPDALHSCTYHLLKAEDARILATFRIGQNPLNSGTIDIASCDEENDKEGEDGDCERRVPLILLSSHALYEREVKQKESTCFDVSVQSASSDEADEDDFYYIALK